MAEYGAGHGAELTRQLRVLVLERSNVSAEYLSFRRALESGNWGTSPQRQQVVSVVQTAGANSVGRLRPIRRVAAHRNQTPKGTAWQGVPSFDKFEREHHAWFADVALMSSRVPRLHIYTENITADAASFDATMRHVFSFLQLPPVKGVLVLPQRVVAPDRAQAGFV